MRYFKSGSLVRIRSKYTVGNKSFIVRHGTIFFVKRRSAGDSRYYLVKSLVSGVEMRLVGDLFEGADDAQT